MNHDMHQGSKTEEPMGEEKHSPSELSGHRRSFRLYAREAYNRLERLTYLEIVGITAIFILVITSSFQFQVRVTRKPWLSRVLGTKESAKTAPVQNAPTAAADQEISELEAKVIPQEGVELPVNWGNIGKRLVQEGVIDQQKWDALYSQRGGVDGDMQNLLTQDNNGKIKITAQNSNTLLNVLWALGIGNKNEILDKGEMWDKQFGGDAGRFASTGGWTLAKGNPMDHYSKHNFVTLTTDQQATVDRVSRGIYRPCCGNSTHFPDCNHGMAMLGLLELMASQGVSEQEMYKTALAVNSYWFPDTYLTIALFMKSQGADWKQVNPQEVLGSAFSSSQGFQNIRAQVEPVAPKAQGGCGV